MSLHTLLFAVCLQLLFACVAEWVQGSCVSLHKLLLLFLSLHILLLAAFCSCCLPVWLELVQGSRVSLHTLLLAVCLQLLFAFAACFGAGLLCEPAHVAARCVLAAVACLCGLN